MEEYAFLPPIIASAFYLVASVRLFRLYRRTSERPELLLSVTFAFAGVYYFAYNASSLFGLDPWSLRTEWMLEWVYISSVFPYMIFIRTVFRPDGAWAGALVAICSAFLLVSTGMGTIEGEIVYSLENTWFLVQWVGYTAPCVWMCWEATLARLGAQKRARLGLAQPIVVNRYLLLMLFAAFQVLACVSDLSLAHDMTSTRTISMISNGLLGGTEIASVVVLWLAFFPPPFYANWIERRAATIPTAVGG